MLIKLFYFIEYNAQGMEGGGGDFDAGKGM